MRVTVVPETLMERAALALGRVPVPLLEMLLGPLQARAIMAGASLGVFEALRDGPQRPAALAGDLGLEPGALELLLRVLAHARYLEQRGGEYRLSGLARRSLVTGAPMQLLANARWNEFQWRLLGELEAMVATGRGVDFHSSLSAAAGWGCYQRAMLELARFDGPVLARLVPVPAGATHLIDLGGGHGYLGAAICRRHRPLRSTVVDLPAAIEHGRALARENCYDTLVDHRAGDLTTDSIEPCDVALLANVLHHLGPSDVTALLARVRAALRPGGTVAIWEIEAPLREGPPDHGALAALFFRLTSTGGAYHGSELASWLTAAGFAGTRILRPRRALGRVLVLARVEAATRLAGWR